MPPKVLLDVPPPSVGLTSTPVVKNHDYVLSLPAPAKTWRKDYHDPHGYAAVRPVRDSKSKSGKGHCVKLSAYIQLYVSFQEGRAQRQNDQAHPPPEAPE